MAAEKQEYKEVILKSSRPEFEPEDIGSTFSVRGYTLQSYTKHINLEVGKTYKISNTFKVDIKDESEIDKFPKWNIHSVDWVVFSEVAFLWSGFFILAPSNFVLLELEIYGDVNSQIVYNPLKGCQAALSMFSTNCFKVVRAIPIEEAKKMMDIEMIDQADISSPLVSLKYRLDEETGHTIYDGVFNLEKKPFRVIQDKSGASVYEKDINGVEITYSASGTRFYDPNYRFTRLSEIEVYDVDGTQIPASKKTDNSNHGDMSGSVC